MPTFSDVLNLIYKAKNDGKVLEYKIVEDRGDRVVINITFIRDDDTIYSKNFVLKIVNRGAADEMVFWVGGRPTELYPQENVEKIPQEVVDKIVGDLQSNYGVVIVENTTKNENAMIVTVVGYVKDVDNTRALVKKTFLAHVSEDGTYSIYEVVG